MPHEVHKHLHDILDALTAIESYTQGISSEDFLGLGMAQAAVERKFEIIGEALKRLQRTDAELFAQIPDAARIVGFRNILAHGYDIVDPELVWDVIANHLPALKTTVETLQAISSSESD
jgi:uncharacterized protein with HEPN domain